jgi:hypothetical protein
VPCTAPSDSSVPSPTPLPIQLEVSVSCRHVGHLSWSGGLPWPVLCTKRDFFGGHCQECPDDPGVVLSRIEEGLAICVMPDGVCADTSECEQFLAYYQRCLKPFQPFVIGEGFANSTVLSVIAACRRPRLKQASGRSVAPSCFLG